MAKKSLSEILELKKQWKDQADIAELIRTNPNLDWEQAMLYSKIFKQEKLLEDIRERLQP